MVYSIWFVNCFCLLLLFFVFEPVFEDLDMAATRSVIITFLLLFTSALALAGNRPKGGLSFETMREKAA
jgi:hypothetical protein